MAKKRIEGPDQPRSWAIAFAACVINTLLSGISRATGLFYVALIETYGVSRMQANLPFTVRNVVRNLAGPLVGAIGQRYGPRDVTIVGGVFASIGIILCTLAPNVIWVIVLWGGVHGFGVALANTLFQVIVTQYFEKYRTTASGLALSGACIGSIIFPVLVEYMLIHLGLAGTFLVTGGIVMHVLPASIMLVEPPWIRRQAESSKEPPRPKPNLKKPLNTMSVIQEDSKTSEEPSTNAGTVSFKRIPSTGKVDVELEDSFEKCPKTTNGISNGIDNPVFSASVVDLNEDTTDQQSEKTRTISIGDTSITVPVSQPYQETSIYRSILKVCKDPMFHLISFSMAAFAMVYDPFITVIVDYLMDKGLKEEVAKYFIILMSLGDLVGRVGFGWVTDKHYMSLPKFMMVLQVGLGVSMVLIPLLYSLDVLMAVFVINGLMSGATLVMYPILVGVYLQSVQSMAIGCISFLPGVLSFAVPPTIGYFRDQVGSYDGMFYITGGLSVVAGLLWLLEPLFTSIKRGKSASIVITS